MSARSVRNSASIAGRSRGPDNFSAAIRICPRIFTATSPLSSASPSCANRLAHIVALNRVGNPPIGLRLGSRRHRLPHVVGRNRRLAHARRASPARSPHADARCRGRRARRARDRGRLDRSPCRARRAPSPIARRRPRRSMVPQSTTCASFSSSLTSRRRSIERTADEHDGRVRRRVLDERLEPLLLRVGRLALALRNQQPLGVGDDDDAPRRHHRQRAAASIRSSTFVSPPYRRSTLKARSSFVDHLGEFGGDGGLLDVVVTDEHVQRIGLAGRDLLLQAARDDCLACVSEPRARARVKTPRRWRSRPCARRRWRCDRRSCAAGRRTRRRRWLLALRVVRSYSSRNESASLDQSTCWCACRVSSTFIVRTN